MQFNRKHILYALALAILLAGVVIPALAASTTTTVDSVGNVGTFTSLVLNSNGFPVISHGGNFLKLAVCLDATCTSATLTTVVANGSESSIVLNANGFPVISYADNFTAQLKLAVCNDATCTSNTITTVDSGLFTGAGNSLVLNANGYPVISYIDSNTSDLKVAVCGDATCTTKTITTVDSAGFLAAPTSIALNASGFPVISYRDSFPASDLKLAVCGNATCTAGNTIVTVDSSGDVGQDNSLALNSSGYPVISYYASIPAIDLKIAVCGDALCSTKTITTVDNAGGTTTSIALNTNDFPIISYYAAGTSDLKVAVCLDTICNAKTLITPDSANNVGEFTSLELNASGFPVVSYYDITNRDLKLATITPPTVGSHTLQATYTGTGPTSFTVTFSEDVSNPAGDSDTDDVTNPNNYKIINKGTNGTVDTASCASAVGGDDTLITPSGVTYTPNTAIVNIGSALPAGSYRLFVCGTTSITDAIGVPLNFGTDFTFDFTVGATTASTRTGKTTASSLPKTGFAPSKVTVLPAQPATLEYAKLGDLWLEIPSLNVKSTIVGVPQNKDNSWDVSWLGNDTGWLNGTAFPTWTGNSVLTAHVTNASGVDGPFAALKSLKYGDQVIVHMGGVMYVYEVRETKLSRPYTTNYVFEAKSDASYLTLVTCSGYNPLNESYLFRRVVRALLVSTISE